VDFLRQYFIEDPSVCDKLIELHKNSKDTYPGLSYDAKNKAGSVDTSKKDSIDLSFSLQTGEVPQHILDYLLQLKEVCMKYVEEFPAVDWYSPWSIVEPFVIQHYRPTGGFKVFHSEKVGTTTANRHLVWMTYLNDVTDGGETEFYHQGYKVKAERGRTVIWPTDWTYTHRGIPSPTQDKYIITGWYNYT
jgi:hypothetical protein